MTNNTPRDPSNDVHIWLRKSDMDKQTVLTRPIFYMVEPTYYDPRSEVREEVNGYVENKFCKLSDSRKFSPSAAQQQHEALQEMIVDLNCSVILGQGRAGQLDGPFTRDAGFAFMEVRKLGADNTIEHVRLKTLTANFFHVKRQEQKETVDFMSAISFLSKRINEDFEGNPIGVDLHQFYPDKHVGEFGDFMYVPSKDILIAGYKPQWATEPEDGRTDIEFHEIASKFFGFENRIVPIEVSNGYFHADTSSKWLPNGKVIAYVGGMSQASFNALSKAAGADNVIRTSKMDAESYACNLLVVDEENIILPAEVSTELVKKIEKTGIKVHSTPLSQFTKFSGGGTNCLTNRLNNIRNKGVDFELPSLES